MTYKGNPLADLWTRKVIIARLVDRFGLSDQIESPQTMLVPRSIQPVTDVDRLLIDAKIKIGASQDPGSTGWLTLMQLVPLGKRWNLLGFWLRRTGTGTASTVRINDGTQTFYLWQESAGTGIFARLENPWPMEEAWSLEGLMETYTAGDTWAIDAFVEEEDAFR